MTTGGFGPRILLRHYFSTHLLWTAFHANEKAREIEEAHTGRSTFDIEHRAHVLSAITAAAGFLEATVNEFFKDAHDKHGLTGDGYLAPLSAKTVEAMASTWKGSNKGFKMNALEKWQRLLVFADRDPLDRESAPYQDAYLVTRLRNAILHFRPEHVAADEPHRMEERLKGKFLENRLMAGSGNAWWPDHCLGHGCAEWAARSALVLADRICSELGIEPNYQRVADKGWHGKDPRNLASGSAGRPITKLSGYRCRAVANGPRSP